MFQSLSDAVSRAFRRFGRRLTGLTVTVSGWVPLWLRPGFLTFVLWYPFRAGVNAWQKRMWRNFIWGLPALFGIVVLVLLRIRGQQAESSIPQWYWNDSQLAIAAKDYPRAEMLLIRLLQTGAGFVNEAKFSLATLYRDTGHIEQAELLFRQLAPDDWRSHSAAHRLRAIDLCALLGETSTPDEISRAHHHLQSAGNETSPEMLLAWGRYEIAMGDYEKARGFLEQTVATFPEAWSTLGTLNLILGKQKEAVQSYTNAKDFLRSQLLKSPEDGQTREELAVVLGRLGEMEEARQVLEKGLKLEPDGNWKILLAGLYVNAHDILSREGGHSLGEMFSPLDKALEYEPNFAPALSRLMSKMNSASGDNFELRSSLSRVVAEGKEPALAHLALGNLCWIENDPKSARFHFERAISINPKLTYVMNNLAWLLAQDQQQSDLERALGMINQALEYEPQNLQFLDTRGTIFMKLQRWNEALADFELVLKETKDPSNGTQNPGPVHGQLAEVYDRLGFPDIATEHRQLAQQSVQPQK